MRIINNLLSKLALLTNFNFILSSLNDINSNNRIESINLENDDRAKRSSLSIEKTYKNFFYKSKKKLYSLDYEFDTWKRKERFIINLKKSIQYDRIVSNDVNFCFMLSKTSLEKIAYIRDPFSIYETIDIEYFDLPGDSFFVKCFENCLLSKVFTDKSDDKIKNVITFFFTLRIIFDLLAPNLIKDYLNEKKLSGVFVSKILKVLLCTKQILVSKASRVSTLEIIKEIDLTKALFFTGIDLELLYSFILIKKLLRNDTLPLVISIDTFFDNPPCTSLNEFHIEVVSLDENMAKIKKVIPLSSYIISHVFTIIEIIFDDYNLLMETYSESKTSKI